MQGSRVFEISIICVKVKVLQQIVYSVDFVSLGSYMDDVMPELIFDVGISIFLY